MKQGTLDLETSHSRLEGAIESILFRNFITTLIIANAVILGLLTYERTLPSEFVASLSWFDRAVTVIFAIEILMKLAVYRLNFFKSGWNWFDFLVVGVSLIPGGAAFSVLRAMRARIRDERQANCSSSTRSSRTGNEEQQNERGGERGDARGRALAGPTPSSQRRKPKNNKAAAQRT